MYSLLTAEPKPLPDALSDLAEMHPFAHVRLIAFDLDGTLIGHPNAILGPHLAKLLGAVAHSNVMLTLATGRTLAGVASVIGQLGSLRRVPLVLYNGSVIIRSEEQALIAHRAIPNMAARRIVTMVNDSSEVSAFVYCIDPEAGLIGGKAVTETVYFAGPSEVAPSVDFNGMPVHPIQEMDVATEKVVAILIAVAKPDVKVVLKSELQQIHEVTVTESGSNFLEVRPAGSSKAFGLKLLCDQLRITAENVLAVGDNDNDVELLSWAGLSVCVRDSSAAARRVSKFYSNHGAGKAAIEILQIVRRAQRLFKDGRRHGQIRR